MKIETRLKKKKKKKKNKKKKKKEDGKLVLIKAKNDFSSQTKPIISTHKKI